MHSGGRLPGPGHRMLMHSAMFCSIKGYLLFCAVIAFCGVLSPRFVPGSDFSGKDFWL